MYPFMYSPHSSVSYLDNTSAVNLRVSATFILLCEHMRNARYFRLTVLELGDADRQDGIR